MLALISLVVATMTAPSAAWASDRIVLLDTCPEKTAPFVCLTMPFEWHWRPSQEVIHRRVPEYEVLRIRGHLLNQPSRVYSVSDDARLDTLRGFSAGNAIGSFAYVGRSKENRPIVLTNRGPFEIEAPFIDVSGVPGLIVVDGKRNKVVTRYFPFDQGEYVVNSPTDVAIWDADRHRCIEAPHRRPGLIRLNGSKCRNFEPLANGLPLPGPASGILDYDQDYLFSGLDLATNQTGPTLSKNVKRIRGTDYYVMQVELMDYCGTDEEPDTVVERLDRPGDWRAFLD
jgi:hypothetical protein